jgi:isoleucyl-tRNA synthetase
MDYKKTLNLPKTAFPMKASLSQREPEVLKKWDTIGLYDQIRESCKGKPRFILHDGPPYFMMGRPMPTETSILVRPLIRY